MRQVDRPARPGAAAEPHGQARQGGRPDRPGRARHQRDDDLDLCRVEPQLAQARDRAAEGDDEEEGQCGAEALPADGRGHRRRGQHGGEPAPGAPQPGHEGGAAQARVPCAGVRVWRRTGHSHGRLCAAPTRAAVQALHGVWRGDGAG